MLRAQTELPATTFVILNNIVIPAQLTLMYQFVDQLWNAAISLVSIGPSPRKLRRVVATCVFSSNPQPTLTIWRNLNITKELLKGTRIDINRFRSSFPERHDTLLDRDRQRHSKIIPRMPKRREGELCAHNQQRSSVQ